MGQAHAVGLVAMEGLPEAAGVPRFLHRKARAGAYMDLAFGLRTVIAYVYVCTYPVLILNIGADLSVNGYESARQND